MADNLVTYYKRGDTADDFRAQVKDRKTDQAKDLTAASQVKILMIKPDGTFFSAVMNVENQATNLGWVNYSWLTNDLALAGNYQGEVEVTWNTGKKQTFPDNAYFQVIVQQDLG